MPDLPEPDYGDVWDGYRRQREYEEAEHLPGKALPVTADTETIREALEMLPNNAGEEWCRANAAALAALGRVEEREVVLEEALEEACDWLDVDLAHAPDTATSMADRELVARWRAALAGSVAEEEHGSGEE